MNRIDIHIYDGNIEYKLSNQIIELDTSIKLSKILLDKDKLQSKLTLKALNYYNLMLNELNINNYDNKNNVMLIDLLYLCSNKIDNDDFINMLNEQLEDMETGFCIQGRTTRLVQLLSAFS